MKKRSLKKLVSSFVIVCMLFSSMGTAFGASASTDIKGHWAEGQISAWIDKGLIKGYEDGSFKPENKITRVEFITLVNRSFGFTEKTIKSFSDVSTDNWAYPEIAIAVKAGYITGYDDGTIGASKPISRQEAVVIVDRLLGLTNTESAATSFADSSSIALWAKGSVDAAVAKGILKGYAEDNSFKPSKSITRAEAVVTLERALAAKARVYSTTGMYGPTTGTETINGDVVINVAGVTLQNVIINGNLLFAAGIGSGDATLNNVNVKGVTTIEGGGENSIHLNNSIILTVIIDKKNGNVRIVAEGSTTVGEVIVNSPAIIQETGTTGVGFSKVTLSELLPADSKVTLKGAFDNLNVRGYKIQIDIPEGSVKEVTVETTATGMILNLGADTKIVSLILDAVVNIVGTGTIETATLSAIAKAGTIFEKEPLKKKDKVGETPLPSAISTPMPTIAVTNPSPSSGLTQSNAPTTSNIHVVNYATTTINDEVHVISVPTGSTIRVYDSASSGNLLGAGTESSGNAQVIITGGFSTQTQVFVTITESGKTESNRVAQSIFIDFPTAPVSDNITIINNATGPDAVSVVDAVYGNVNLYDETGSYIASGSGSVSSTISVTATGGLTVGQAVYVAYLNINSGMTGFSEGLRTSVVVPDEIILTTETATAPSAVVLDVGSMNPVGSVTNVTIPAAGAADTTGTVAGWVTSTADKIKFTVTNGGTAMSTIIINGVPYTSGTDYTITEAAVLTIIVTTTESTKETGVRTFIVPVGTPLPGDSGTGTIPALQIVNNGQPTATIRVALNADNQTQDAAAKLAEYVKKSTGADLPIVVDDASGNNLPTNNAVEIYVGTEGLPTVEGQENPLEGLDGDGFVIQQNGTRITIAGPTSWGTEFGVDEFLERYVGVSWLAPGEDWEDVPLHTDLSVSLNDMVRQEPVFFSREFDVHASNTPEREEWVRNNRMHGRVEFKHNLFNLFPLSQYKISNPEFFPQGDLDAVGGWQPCFKAEGIVEEAINNINAYFDANPEATSYSLGVNDSLASGSGYCEDKPSHPNFPNKVNSVGFTDMSDIYYNWVNEVSIGVFAEHPDKYLGLLAYVEVYDPPTNVTLDPRVIVYITDDRLTWEDSALRADGHELTENWAKAAEGVAYYEYLFGTPYMVPRTYFNTMEDNYKYANGAGVTAHYAELVPNFGEGPKPWLSTRLQWNPEQDANALITEWYERSVGAEAAVDLAAYYEIWRDFWENRIFQTNWYSAWAQSDPRNNYLSFTDDSYLEAVTAADMAVSRSLLESVVVKAVTVKQKKRAAALLRSFEYYEASALSYPVENRVVLQPTDESKSLTLVQSVMEKIKLAEKRRDLVEDFTDDSFLQQALSPYGIDGISLGGYGRGWSGITKAEIDVIVAWLEQEATEGAVHLLLKDLSLNDQVMAVRSYATILLSSADTEKRKQMNYNPSFEFEGPTADLADSWNLWLFDGLEMKRTNEVKRSGEYSVKAKGIKFGGLIQAVPVQSGTHLMSFAYYSPEASTGKGTIRLALDFWNANNEYMGTVRPYLETKRIADTAGEWVSMYWVGELPAGIAKVDATLLLENFDLDQVIYIDDFGLDRLSPDVYADNPKTPINLNASFENGGATPEAASPWTLWLYDGQEMKRTDEVKKSGNYSLIGKGVKVGGIMQSISVQTGVHGLSVDYFSPPESEGSGTIRLQLDLYDAENNFIRDIRPVARRASNTAGGWSTLEWVGELPVGVSSVTVGAYLNNFEDDQKIYIDNANFYRLSPELYADSPKTPINVNTSFENGGGTPEAADPWTLWLYNGLEMKRTDEVKKSGDYSIVAKGVKVGGIMQSVLIEPGIHGMSIDYYSPPATVGSGTIRLQIDLYDAQNNFIRDIRPAARPISTTAGGWFNMDWIGELPEGVSKVTVGVFLENLDDEQKVYIDDVKFYRLSPDLYADSPKTPITLNASFDNAGDTPEAANLWTLWLYNGQEMKRTNEVKKNGDYSIVAKGINYGGIMQQVPVQAGIHGMSVAYYSPSGSAGNGTIRLQLDLYDAQNNFIGDIKPAVRRISYTAGDWFNIDWMGELPEGVSKVTVGVFLENFGVEQKIYIDDVNFYSLP